MSQHVVLGYSFLYYLYYFDQLIAEDVKSSGCQHCGSPLHNAHYSRKPRGIPRHCELVSLFSTRFSFCCSQRECRKRHTPASVRFLGRRVYVALIFMLVSSDISTAYQKENIKPSRAEPAKPVSKQTQHRWLSWWGKTFKQSSKWRYLKGFYQQATQLPRDWFLAIRGQSFVDKCLCLLKHLMPFSTYSSHYLTGFE